MSTSLRERNARAGTLYIHKALYVYTWLQLSRSSRSSAIRTVDLERIGGLVAVVFIMWKRTQSNCCCKRRQDSSDSPHVRTIHWQPFCIPQLGPRLIMQNFDQTDKNFRQIETIARRNGTIIYLGPGIAILVCLRSVASRLSIERRRP